MSGIDEAVKFAARRSRDEVQADAELRRHSSKRTERHSVNVAVLQTRHERGRDSGLPRQIALTQATLDASGAEREAEAEAKIIHGRRMDLAAHRALIRRFRAYA